MHFSGSDEAPQNVNAQASLRFSRQRDGDKKRPAMQVTRRAFLRGSAAAGLLACAPSAFIAHGTRAPHRPSGHIDRRALLRRHNPIITRFDPFSALSVGNGEAAFTADITGLQTFVSKCEKLFPLCTASHWGWHTTPAASALHRGDSPVPGLRHLRPIRRLRHQCARPGIFIQLAATKPAPPPPRPSGLRVKNAQWGRRNTRGHQESTADS